MTQKQIRARLKHQFVKVERYDAIIETLRGRIKMADDRRLVCKDRIRSLQSDCEKLGHVGYPCHFCRYHKSNS